jgi:hypothetical protein
MRLPIGPKPGITQSPTFSVNLKGRYSIGLEVDRKIEDKKLNCLLGWNDDPSNKCIGLSSKVDVGWKLISDGKMIAHGSSIDMASMDGHPMRQGGWVSSKEMFRTIGRFDGDPRKIYLLEVHLLDDISALAPTAPRIAIHVAPLTFEGYAMLADLVRILAILFVVIGLAWQLVHFIRHRISDKKA